MGKTGGVRKTYIKSINLKRHHFNREIMIWTASKKPENVSKSEVISIEMIIPTPSKMSRFTFPKGTINPFYEDVSIKIYTVIIRIPDPEYQTIGHLDTKKSLVFRCPMVT